MWRAPATCCVRAAWPTIDTVDLVLGNYAGPMGTTVLLVILACALYLIHRRRMGLVAPLCFIFACAFMAFFFPRLGDLAFAAPWEHLLERLQVVKYELCTGGVLFAAVFLINDPVTLPKSNASRAVYGLVLGVATMLFRYYGTYETGVCFALLAGGRGVRLDGPGCAAGDPSQGGGAP